MMNMKMNMIVFLLIVLFFGLTLYIHHPFGQVGENVADVNGDGIVDIRDLVLVANAFGQV